MKMQQPQQLIIVGGGTAGWLTACVIAAEHKAQAGIAASVKIQLIESPDIPTIGVGEGSWPSMRQTLQKIGISETEFFRACDVSPKQGSKFVHWLHAPQTAASADEAYLHPFTVPAGYPDTALALSFLHSPAAERGSYAAAMTPQGRLSLAGKAPKTIGTPDYQFMQNYGYHLNAGKFAALLQRHATQVLGVEHVADTVTQVQVSQGQIAGVTTSQHGLLQADFYIDCSGTQSLLLGGALAEPFISCKAMLGNDRALALQLPYDLGGACDAPASAIFSNTVATAQQSGWIWDISLPNRCGIGHVYASEFLSDEQAYANVLAYAERRLSACNRQFASASAQQKHALLDGLMVKKLQINPGHYQRCMVGNCMAIGMAAGFIEPLEASALALVEWSAKTIAKALPLHANARSRVADRINQQFVKHWASIIDFLKLHYVLSQRDEPYWQMQRAMVPASLAKLLDLWQYQVPDVSDFPDAEQLFPAASYSYVLYGMGFEPRWLRPLKSHEWLRSQQLQAQLRHDLQQLSQLLPDNASLVTQIAAQGLSRL